MSFILEALCLADDLSNWSGPRQFATLIENDECATATVVPVNPDLECDEVASGILIGATASQKIILVLELQMMMFGLNSWQQALRI